MRAPAVLLVLLASSAMAHPTRPGCTGPLPAVHGLASPGDGGYTLTPSSSGGLTLAGPTPFKGFLLKADAGVALGVAPGSQGVAQTVCGGVGHSSPDAKTSVGVTLPPGSSGVNVQAFVLQGVHTWYTFNTRLP